MNNFRGDQTDMLANHTSLFAAFFIDNRIQDGWLKDCRPKLVVLQIATSASFLAKISVSSPQKIFIFIM